MFDTTRYRDPWTLDDVLPPRRIVTDRMVMRCLEPSDATLMKAAVEESLDHLVVWLPAARTEPMELDAVTRRLERFEREFLAGAGFVYGLFDEGEQQILGCIGLMPRLGRGVLEIGYWIHVARVGRGLATEATRALTVVALDLPAVERLEIHCDPANEASVAIPNKLGYTLRGPTAPAGPSPESPSASTVIFELVDARHLPTDCVP